MSTSCRTSVYSLTGLAAVMFVSGTLSSCAIHPPKGPKQADVGPTPPAPRLVTVWTMDGAWEGVATSPRGDRLFAVSARGLAEISPTGDVLSLAPGVARHTIVAVLGCGQDNLQVFVAAQGRGVVQSYSGAGALLWTHEIGGAGVTYLSPVDRDCGVPEGVLVGSPSGATFLGLDGEVHWRSTRPPAHKVSAMQRGEMCVALIASGFTGLHVLDMATGTRLGRLPVPLATAGYVQPLQSPAQLGSDLILVGGADQRRHEILVAITSEGTVKGEYRLSSTPYDYIVSMAVLPTRSLVAVSLRSGTLKVIEVPTMRTVAEEPVNTGRGYLAWVERDGGPPVLYLATGSQLVGYQLP
jgi:hypothetical protein